MSDEEKQELENTEIEKEVEEEENTVEKVEDGIGAEPAKEVDKLTAV